MPNEHTPGPWEAIQLGGDNGIRHVWAMDSDGGAQVASTFPVGGSHDAKEANALLCAAAPDMLAALERLMAYEGDGPPLAVFDDARAAISKAKGVTDQ